MSKRVPPAAIVGGSPEAERQAAELGAVRRMLHASRGCFSLSTAVCNSPALRDHLIGELCREFDGIRVAPIPAGTVDVFTPVAAEPENSPPAALFLTGIEASLPSQQPSQHTLRSLNASRELWPKRFPCPIILWLPEYAATLLAQQAPDFWRYRSHAFEFVSEQATAAAGTQDRTSGDLTAAGELTADQKQFRIAELEQRIADAGDNPPESLIPHVPAWLNELGYLYHSTGHPDRAEEMFGKLLEVEERLGRLEGMASGYANLGAISHRRGDLDRAEEMHRKSLEINEKLRRREGIAQNLANLGTVYGTRGDLDRAEQMYRKSLEICESFGGLEDVAVQYGNLGVLFERRGDLNRAEEMHHKSLEINEKLRRREGLATQYGNLGMVYRTRGDLDRAEEMCRKSLEINEELGRLEGMANQYGNLGIVAWDRNHIPLAREFFTRALDLFQKIGAEPKIEKTKSLLDDLPEESKP